MKACVFIPADLEQGKIVGSAVYGPTLVAVEGGYDDVNRLCSELSDKYPWAFVNINMRALLRRGQQDARLRSLRATGLACAGPLHSATGQRLPLHEDIQGDQGVRLAWPRRLERHPHERYPGARLLAHIRRLAARELHHPSQKPNTIAKSLAIGNPADGYYALKALEQTGGASAAVTDEEIVDGIKLLAETEGIFAETAGGSSSPGCAGSSRAGTSGRTKLW